MYRCLRRFRGASPCDRRKDGNATGRRIGRAGVGDVTISRLPSALSFVAHSAALALIAWLGSRPPSLPDQPAPQPIPLLFIEQSPSSDQTPQSDQTTPATPGTRASEPSEATEQSPSSSPAVEQKPSPDEATPVPPVAAASEPAAAPHPSMPTAPASEPELRAEEPVPIPQEKPPPRLRRKRSPEHKSRKYQRPLRNRFPARRTARALRLHPRGSSLRNHTTRHGPPFRRPQPEWPASRRHSPPRARQ